MVHCCICRKWHWTKPWLSPLGCGSIVFCGLGETSGFSSIGTGYLMLHELNATKLDPTKLNNSKSTAAKPATGNLHRTEKLWNQPPPNSKPSIWERQTENPPIWKSQNHKPMNQKLPDQKPTNQKSPRFAMVGVTKRWAVSRLEDTKPSTTGRKWREQEGAYNKG